MCGRMCLSGLERSIHQLSFSGQTYFRVCLLAAGIFLTACAAGRVRDGSYINEAKSFAVQLPSKAWSVETADGADLVLRHAHRTAGISIHGTCGEIPPDRPVAIVSRHLFFGIHGKEIVRQERRLTTQGEALEVVLRGELEGRELVLHGYTLKGPTCVYDLVLFAAPEDYVAVDGEFEALAGRFHVLMGEER